MTQHAFIQGYVEGSLDADRSEMTTREIQERHPEMTANEADAYAQGRVDALMGDPWRYDGLTK